MPSTATITGKIGPGTTVTSLVLNDVTEAHFDFAKKSILSIKQATQPNTREFDLNATTTVTLTMSVGVGTLTVSQ